MKTYGEYFLERKYGEFYKALPEPLQDYLKEIIERAANQYFQKHPTRLRTPLKKLKGGVFEPVDYENIRAKGGIDSLADRYIDTAAAQIAIGSIPTREIPKRTAIALSGDGINGAFQAGALYCLEYKWRDLNVIGVTGRSMGAVSALAISALAGSAAEELLSIYFATDSGKDLYCEQNWFTSFKNLIKERMGLSVDILNGKISEENGNLFTSLFKLNMPPMVWPYSILSALLTGRNLKNVSDQIKIWLDSAKSFFSIDPLIKLVTAHIDIAKVGKIPLRMYMVRLSHGDIYYVDQQGTLHGNSGYGFNGSDSREVRLEKSLRASTATPGLFSPVQLGENLSSMMIDSSVRENLPNYGAMEMVMQSTAEGIPQVVSIFDSPWSLYGMDMHDPLNISRIYQQSINLLQKDVLMDEVQPAYGYCDKLKRINICSLFPLIESMNFDPGLVRIMAADGYMAAYDRAIASLSLWLLVSGWYISYLRLIIWELEHNEMLEPSDRDPSTGQIRKIYFDENVIKEIRKRKTELHRFILSRHNITGDKGLPIKLQANNGAKSLIKTCWESWEEHGISMAHETDHNWLKNPHYASPWLALPSRTGTIPAETPPSTPTWCTN